ncbi:MAG: MBL fold metallo-hydrolase [Alistipes sp.]|nr:MBL fold metallo-hydrolase [Candidatus Alistipes equi]
MISVERFEFNPIWENTFLVWDETKECIIIDAGNSTDEENRCLCDFIKSHELKPVALLTTHGHCDHTAGVAYLKERFQIEWYCSFADKTTVKKSEEMAHMFGWTSFHASTPDRDLSEMKKFTFGNTTLEVIPTPGHTPGGVAFFSLEDRILFSGDTLFKESVGRTDFEGGDLHCLMHSIVDSLIKLGDDVSIFPGHGAESTIGHETMYNPYIVDALNHIFNY